MELIYESIASNPGYFAWAFGLVNALWAAFLYFNKKRHERELIGAQQTLDLDLERRKKIFEMKAAQYESYFKHIDAVHNKHQADYQDVLVPIINDFMEGYLSATDKNDQEEATQSTIRLSERLSRLMRDGFEELGVIESETNSLRLTACDEVASLLDDIKGLYERLFALSGTMMSELVNITIHNNQQLANELQSQLLETGQQVKAKAADLREAMRNDLKRI